MAPPAGLEPATPGLGIQRTIWGYFLFSFYFPLFLWVIIKFCVNLKETGKYLKFKKFGLLASKDLFFVLSLS